MRARGPCNCGGVEYAKQLKREAQHPTWCDAYDGNNGIPYPKYREDDRPDPNQALYQEQLEAAYRTK